MKERYPDFEIIPLPNLPNWDVRDAVGNTVPHNAGDNSKPSIANATWMELCDSFMEKMANKGVSNPISYIEVDHPFFYYTKNGGRETSRQRIQAMKDYCAEHNLEMIVIVNQSKVGDGDDASKDAAFKQGCLGFVDAMFEDNINPSHIDVESWYPFPQYLVPETKENSFTNVIRDVGKQFQLATRIEITTEQGLTEISELNKTLQLFAIDKNSGEQVVVNWIVDDENICTIDENGLLTSVNWGEATITATAKDGPAYFADITIKVVEPEQAIVIVIKSEGDATEIEGIGSTLQLYAEDSITGEEALVDWSIDSSSMATIDSTGLLTSLNLGAFSVTAVLRSNSDVKATFKLTIVDNSIGISHYSYLEQIRIFPNPVNKKLSIEVPENPDNYREGEMSLRCIDITGKTLDIESSLHTGINTISMEGFCRGMYFIQISSQEGSKMFKIIKQ